MDNTALVENLAIYREDFGELDDYNEFNDEGHSFEQRGMLDNTEENTGEMQMQYQFE